jgi:uncharacterized protein (DUF2141 family)
MKSTLIAASIAACMMTVLAPRLAIAQPDFPTQGQAHVERAPIEIVVWNVRKALGHIRISICTKETFAYANRTCPYHGDAAAHAGVTTVVVPDVPAGQYAVEVYQDEQDLNKISRGPLGIPLVGVGFSNDAPVGIRPPHFRDASFQHDPAQPLSLRIKLRYFPEL